MSGIDWLLIRRALRRSRVRAGVLLALSLLREATLADLARVAGVEPDRALDALFGHKGTYKPSESLVPLGLAEEVTRPDATRIYRILPVGMAVAEAWRRESIAALVQVATART